MSKMGVLNCGDDIYRMWLPYGVGEIDKLIMRDVTIAVFRIYHRSHIHHIHHLSFAYISTPLFFSP